MVWSANKLNAYIDRLIPHLAFKKALTNLQHYEDFAYLITNEHRDYVIDYCLDQIIAKFAREEDTDESELFEDFEMVAGFFINICANWPFIVSSELQSENGQKRCRLLLILKSLFSLRQAYKHITVARHLASMSVWDDMLARFNDGDVEIRIICLDIASVLLKTESSYKVITDMRKCIARRLLDRRFKVRLKAIHVVENVASVSAEKVCCPKLMKNFASRCADTSKLTRFSALVSNATVHQILAHYSITDKIFVNHVFKVSSACLERYKAYEVEEEEKIHVETVFQKILVEFHISNTERKVKNFVRLIKHSTNDALRSIAAMFLFHRRMRNAILRILNLLAQSTKLAMLQLSKCLDSIANYLHVPDVEDHEMLNFLFRNRIKNDTNLIENLRKVFGDNCLSQESMKQALKQLHEKVDEFEFNDWSAEDEHHLIDVLVLRSGFLLIDETFLLCLLSELNTLPDVYNIRSASLLTLLSVCYPQYFRLESIKKALASLNLKLIITLSNDAFTSLARFDENVNATFRTIIENTIPFASSSPEY
ncbi:hypothetical protein B4U79_17503 [Dinothrombium tinctorium]|uniref:Uncharacterized protein n=1 Tax=Dinothrombium tinctorium TaxID=1965070 RepID=A0A3S3PG58_9ACAR|nr:hypothetical protein B4U79_17519 [Dinothrombium tinctorium]RWS11712.1 hypothetical protein B4U79_17504 [Dinothrombium tinctorium]RWS11745.1 hypothetical protein B4U79_17503 [Dinothrombium tinctorium]